MCDISLDSHSVFLAVYLANLRDQKASRAKKISLCQYSKLSQPATLWALNMTGDR